MGREWRPGGGGGGVKGNTGSTRSEMDNEGHLPQPDVNSQPPPTISWPPPSHACSSCGTSCKAITILCTSGPQGAKS